MNQACTHVEGSCQALALQDWAARRCTRPLLHAEHCVAHEQIYVWSLGCVLYAVIFGEGPYDTVIQKDDSLALAAQNQFRILQSPRHSLSLWQLLASKMSVDPQ